MQLAMDNGPAQKAKEAVQLKEASEIVGDMVDVSILRREVRKVFIDLSIFG